MAFAAVPTQCPFPFEFFSFVNYIQDLQENDILALFDSRIAILLFINTSCVLYSYISVYERDGQYMCLSIKCTEGHSIIDILYW